VTVADPGFTNGGKEEAPQAPRGLGVWRWCPLPTEEVRGGGDALPINFVSILDLKMATLGVFWSF